MQKAFSQHLELALKALELMLEDFSQHLELMIKLEDNAESSATIFVLMSKALGQHLELMLKGVSHQHQLTLKSLELMLESSRPTFRAVAESSWLASRADVENISSYQFPSPQLPYSLSALALRRSQPSRSASLRHSDVLETNAQVSAT